MTQPLDTLLDLLETQGWAMSDDIIPPELTHRLRTEGMQRWQQGEFHAARIGRQQQEGRHPEIRGDTICWLDHDNRQPASSEFLAWTDELRMLLNRHFYLGLRHLEMHYARYDSGMGYARHMDQHRGMPYRMITILLYLNPDWQPGDGGELRLFEADNPEREFHRLEPLAGRLLLFRSDLIPHEVLPCTQPRWSLTGWFRTDDPALLPAMD